MGLEQEPKKYNTAETLTKPMGTAQKARAISLFKMQLTRAVKLTCIFRRINEQNSLVFRTMTRFSTIVAKSN